jgi:hypothetical protein
MSDPISNGGSAFPRTTFVTPEQDHIGNDGMTLRDWFAGQIASGVSSSMMSDIAELSRKHGMNGVQGFASYCYQTADAMIAEREKGGAK